MEEKWTPIDEFVGYMISDHGRVLNEKTGRILSLSVNQASIVQVGLWSKNMQTRRSVSSLVAKAFLPSPKYDTFDTVINKDGDRHNNFAINLDWRPRWFAFKYHRQFARRGSYHTIAIADMDSGEEFRSLWDAAIKYGLLVTEVMESIDNQTSVWPTHQRFWRID